MQKILPPGKICVKDSNIPDGGRGVFATADIINGELIERCPIIEISHDVNSNLDEGILITYFYYFGKKEKGQALALGFGSIYNHTRKPNAKYIIKKKDSVIEFIASRDIKKDEEITVNYNYLNPNDKTPMWFE